LPEREPGLQEELDRIDPPALAEDGSRRIDLNPVVLDENGQSVGPDLLDKATGRWSQVEAQRSVDQLTHDQLTGSDQIGPGGQTFQAETRREP